MTAATITASFIAALLAHEAGHFTMARALGHTARFVRFGTSVRWGSDRIISAAHDRALVSMAGPLASLLFAIACWLAVPHFAAFAGVQLILTNLAFASLALALVNLAPLPCSDGFQAYTATRRHAAR